MAVLATERLLQICPNKASHRMIQPILIQHITEQSQTLFKEIYQNPEHNHLKFTNVRHLIKIAQHSNKQECLTHDKENNWSIETDPKVTGVVKLTEKAIKNSCFFFFLICSLYLSDRGKVGVGEEKKVKTTTTTKWNRTSKLTQI